MLKRQWSIWSSSAQHTTRHRGRHSLTKESMDPRCLWSFLERIGAVTRPLTGNDRQREREVIQSQKQCYFHRRDLPWCWRIRYPTQPLLTHNGSMLSTVWITVIFSPLMVLVGWQDMHSACKTSATTLPKSLLLLTTMYATFCKDMNKLIIHTQEQTQ